MTQRLIAEFLGAYKAPRLSVRITTRSDLLAQVERIANQIESLPRGGEDQLNSDRSRLMAELDAAVQLVRDSEFEFEFEALSSGEYDRMLASMPPTPSQAEQGAQFNAETFPVELLHRCAVNPTLSLEDARDLVETLSDSQFRKLWMTAAAVNVGDDSAPKVVTSSVTEDPAEM